MSKSQERLLSIDILRALSILMVIFYHYRPFPGGDFFSMGHYGVVMFFMISGYCIHFSQQSSASALSFYLKRLYRLLPALAVVSLLIVAVKYLFWHSVPNDHIRASYADVFLMLIGLPLLDVPLSLWNLFASQRVSYSVPDTAYWSLQVEFQFYVLSALLYIIPARYRNWGPAGLAVLMAAVQVFNFPNVLGVPIISQIYPFREVAYFYPFFAIGMAAAQPKGVAKTITYITATLSLAWVVVAGIQNTSIPFKLGATSFVVALFFVILFLPVEKFKESLVLRLVQIVGFISYPLYLIHQHVGQIFLNLWGHYQEPSLLKVLIVVTGLIFVSAAVYYFVEKPLSKRRKQFIL
jgi:peptidoglycan/LPS O-acetylase OafA/YrhL